MLVGGLVGGLVFWLIFGLVGGGLIRSGLVAELFFVLLFGLNSGLSFGLVVGLVVGLVRGGLAYLQHYCLRFLLWLTGAMPWHYVRFLEEATERILLQRVGGGYRFIHPLFQDYFASLGTPAPPSSDQSPPSRQP